MTTNDLKSLALKIVGSDTFYEDFRVLKEDIDFFHMYLKRNQKSSKFYFKVVPVGFGTIKVFEDVIKAYGLSDSFLEEEYTIYTLIKTVIIELSNMSRPNLITDEQIKEFSVWLYKELGLYISDYVSDFVGCSNSCTFVKNKLYDLLNGIIPLDASQPKKFGRWIELEFGQIYKCSECGFLTDYRLSDYCPDCGVRMIKED